MDTRVLGEADKKGLTARRHGTCGVSDLLILPTICPTNVQDCRAFTKEPHAESALTPPSRTEACRTSAHRNAPGVPRSPGNIQRLAAPRLMVAIRSSQRQLEQAILQPSRCTRQGTASRRSHASTQRLQNGVSVSTFSTPGIGPEPSARVD